MGAPGHEGDYSHENSSKIRNMTNPSLLKQLFFVMMGMYFTVQLVTLEWSMLL